ncbi:MAG: hypothetical protein AAF806_25980 [Bacteroidota bacterium]
MKKNKKKSHFFSLFFFFSYFVISFLPKTVLSQTVFESIKTFPLTAETIHLDQLHQLYLIKTDNTLLKFDAKGEQQFEYSNSLLGDISWVDVTDPLNIAIYYANYQSVVLLDRNLTELQVISLFELGFGQVSAIGISNNQNIWLYDENDFKLKRIDRQGKVVFESGDLSMNIGRSIQPVQLLERDNKIFANDPEQGIFVFDLFGQYLYHLNIQHLSSFQILDKHLIYFENHQLKSWNLQSKLETVLAQWKKEAQIRQVWVDQQERLYVLKDNTVEVLRFP